MTQSASAEREEAVANVEPVVVVEHLTKSFDGRIVLDDVHLRVASGTIVSIIGQSGGGKSTLLRCVNLLERPDRAELRESGVDTGLTRPGMVPTPSCSPNGPATTWRSSD